MKNIFIGIDHGGTNTTALVFDLNKGVRSCESVPMPKSTPQEGIVEHNPDDFLNTSIQASKLALDKSNLDWNFLKNLRTEKLIDNWYKYYSL